MRNKLAAIVDYGVGNIRSVSRVLESALLSSGQQVEVILTRDHSQILNADLIVLPGVGSFGSASEQLAHWKVDLVSVIRGGTPTLGVCLGMQLLFEKSEESPGEGLAIFEGSVTKMTSKTVPHMGWNTISDSDGLPSAVPWAYFAHSFACRPDDENIVAGWTTYDGDRFASIVRKNNILGTQFHPEKSDLAGVKLVHSFVSEVLS